MAREKKPEEKSGGAPAWMMTYGDMMSLLLTFFVLIVSFSTIQEAGFKAALGSLQAALGVLMQNTNPFVLEAIRHPEKLYAFLSSKMKQTTGDISDKLNFVSQMKDAQVRYDEQGIHIILPTNVLFESGTADIKQESHEGLKKIGAFLYENHSKIVVEGHTDNVPIRSAKYPSNWELSVARATSVMRFFNQACGMVYENMSIAGYGQYDPIASNDTEEGREKNRRVEIIILTGHRPKSYVLR